MRATQRSTLAIVVITIAMALPLVGCESAMAPDIQAIHTQASYALDVAKDALDQAQATQAQLARDLKAMPAGVERDKLLSRLAVVEAGLNTAQAKHTQATEALANLVQAVGGKVGLDALGAALPVVQPLLVPVLGPYAAIITAAGGLAIGLIRSWRNRRAGSQVVKALEVARSINAGAGVDFTDDKTKAVLDAVMGPAGKALVDRATGKSTGLPF